MDFKSFNKAEGTVSVEKWSTRFGVSVRVVKRNAGRFVNNKSAKQLVKA